VIFLVKSPREFDQQTTALLKVTFNTNLVKIWACEVYYSIIMKPYGLRVILFPDVGDIHEMGSKSSIGGRNYGRNVARKQRARRRWARKARALGKRLCNEDT
jgi:hypothetical protein